MKLPTLLTLGLLAPFVAQATVTVQIQSGNFADSLGTAQSGMPYAIVVSTEDNTFSAGSYDPFDISAVDPTSGGFFLTVGGIATDDWYTFGSALNSTASGPPPSFLSGYANQVSTIIIDSDATDPISPISTNDSFAVIWFADGNGDAGSDYGFYTDSGLIVPSQGATVNFSSSIGNGVKVAEYTLVPEPQTYAAIIGLAALVVVRLRRRK